MANELDPRIGLTGVTRANPVLVRSGSKDEYYLSDTEYFKIPDFIVQNVGAEAENFEESTLKRDKPEGEDIELVESESVTYVDKDGATRAKLVFKVRNTSGKTLLGVDVRKAQ
jgi:hypothetical protein